MALKLGNLKRTEASAGHQTAATAGDMCAPSIQEFVTVLQHFLEHHTAANKEGLRSVGRGKKIRRMITALADATKRLDHEFIRAPVHTVTLMRDVRHGRMALRFMAVDKRLRTRSGLMSWLPVDDGSGAGMLRLTSQGLTRFATTCVASTKAATLHAEIRKHIRRVTHTMSVDSAINEVNASKMMRRPMLDTMPALTPNLAVVNRDQAHRSRRIISRPWTKVAVLHDVHLHVASARGSPAQLIHWSPEMRIKFRSIVQQHFPGMRVSNLRAAKHRFESYQKPLARACRLMTCFMAFVIQLVHQPASEPQRYACKFLRWVTDMKYLLCGMMADAADELSQLVRFVDREAVETERMNLMVARFMWKCNCLFGPRRGALEQD